MGSLSFCHRHSLFLSRNASGTGGNICHSEDEMLKVTALMLCLLTNSRMTVKRLFGGGVHSSVIHLIQT